MLTFDDAHNMTHTTNVNSLWYVILRIYNKDIFKISHEKTKYSLKSDLDRVLFAENLSFRRK